MFQTTNQNSSVATNLSWSALDPEHNVGSIGNISSHMASPGYWNLANPLGGCAVLWQLGCSYSTGLRKKGCAKAPGNDIFLRKMDLLITGYSVRYRMVLKNVECPSDFSSASGQVWTASQSSPHRNPVLIPASHGWKLRQGQRPLPQLRQWIHQCLGFLAMEARIKMGEIHNCFFFEITSGNLLHSYWKWPFIVDFPIKNGDFP